MSHLPDRRLLLVHAHPDDESIGNGATMARYAAEGARVTLVTCTLGEEGEVIPAALAHLAADREDALGPYRAGELAAAMRELGVSDHRFLGGAGRYRDSGMMGTPQNEREGCLWRTRVEDAAPDLVAVVREVRPQVVVTYDPDGGYGHPDHIRAHQIAMRAVELAADGAYRPDLGAAHEVARVYWNCVPRSHAEAGLARLRESRGDTPFTGTASLDALPGVVGDDEVDIAVDGGAVGGGAGDGGAYAERKAAAMRAHATQITVHGGYFALSDGMGQPLHGTEFYRLARGRAVRGGGGGPTRPGGDLFEGLGV